jgi:dTDP-4-dehydrorhamnose 3,5-epimerase
VRAVPTTLPGVVIIEPDVHQDPRGFFLETYHAAKYRAAGIDGPFVQDNHSRSVRGTLRGLHLQLRHAQGKLVDVRRGSPTFGQWVGVTLSAENFRQCYVPPGFAHGFAVVSPVAQVEYKCTDIYDPKSEIGIAWNDPAIGINWPIADPLLSDRDTRHLPLASVIEQLPAFAAETDL